MSVQLDVSTLEQGTLVTPKLVPEERSFLLSFFQGQLSDEQKKPGPRGRGQTLLLEGLQGKFLVRPLLRGGWVQLITKRWHFGLSRAVQELVVSHKARALGLDTPEVVAAFTRSRFCFYQAWVVLRFEDGQDMAAHLQSAPNDQQAIQKAAEAIAIMHRIGLSHADLQIKNLLRKVDGKVSVLDLDRAKLNQPSLAKRLRSIKRLGRSLRKLERRCDQSLLSLSSRLRFVCRYALQAGDWPQHKALYRDFLKRLSV